MFCAEGSSILSWVTPQLSGLSVHDSELVGFLLDVIERDRL